MDDKKIVGAIFERDERGLEALREKYSRYLMKIAYRITGDLSDSEEVLNDVYMGAWRAIPPERPDELKTWIAKLTRRTAVDVVRKRGREKRKCYSQALDELSEAVPSGSDTESECDGILLAEAVNRWLGEIQPKQRRVFLLRYFFGMNISEISKTTGYSESKVKSMLYRLRGMLKKSLEKNGMA